MSSALAYVFARIFPATLFADPRQPAMEDYLRLANTQNPITAAAFPAQFQALTLLSSIARLLVPLHLTPRAITWWNSSYSVA